MGFEGQVAVVTGGPKAGGKATAPGFADECATVALPGTAIPGANVGRLIGKDALFIRRDFGVSAALAAVEKRFGHVDAFVNDTSDQDWRRVAESLEGEWDRATSVDQPYAIESHAKAIP